MGSLSELLKSDGPVIFDGAMGTELQRRGIYTGLPLWSAAALIDTPDAVRQIHADYIAAGAQIITTNTFRTTRYTFARAGKYDQSRALTLKACEMARQAVAESGRSAVTIAGSVATLEDCYRPDLVPVDDVLQVEHRHNVRSLVEGRADFIFAETMNSIREAEAVLAAAREAGMACAVSFVCDSDGNLLSGESIEEAVARVAVFSPLMIGTNCAPLARIRRSVQRLCAASPVPVVVYANGDGEPDDAEGWKFSITEGPANYLAAAAEWVRAGAKVIGGCCGTTPEYISKLAAELR